MLILVNVFICIFLVFAWSWNDPAEAILKRLVRLFRRQVSWLGLRHDWSMFAPEPVHVDRRLQAEIRLENGEVIVWEAVRLDKLTRWQAFLKARDRKYQTNILLNRLKRLRPALAEYLARTYGERGHAVQEVRLVRVQRPIPDPRDGDPVPQPFGTTVLYTYKAAGGDGDQADAARC